jgi:hypothetical protein
MEKRSLMLGSSMLWRLMSFLGQQWFEERVLSGFVRTSEEDEAPSAVLQVSFSLWRTQRQRAIRH